MHHDRTWCMNLTSGTSNIGSAVLIRALKPIGTTKELGVMRGRRRDWYQSACLDDDILFQKISAIARATYACLWAYQAIITESP